MNSGTTGAYDPRRMKPSPASADVGAALMQKGQMQQGMGGPQGMMDPAMMDPEMLPEDEMAMMEEGEPLPTPQDAFNDTVEPFDSATEHSASASRNALAEGIQRAMGMSKPSNPRVRPAYNKTQLAQLGLPQSEIELLSMNDPAYGG